MAKEPLLKTVQHHAVGLSGIAPEQNPFLIAQRQLDEAAKIMKLDPAVHELLRWPMRELHVTIPVRMDDGTVKIFHGFRVQYNDARGPCKGGIRYHPEETIDTVRALAAWMTWKTAVLDLPLGGGKGGIVCNPKEMSPGELERLSRGYIRQVGRILGEDIDVPAPDVNTTPQIMAWMMDEYSVMRGYNVPGVITGKPVPLGGSLGRTDATARGGMYCIREAAKVLGIDLKDATVAVQGFGNVGSWTAILCHQMGLKVIAVSDETGGLYNPNGLNIPALAKHAQQHPKRWIEGYTEPGADWIPKEEGAKILELPVTILFPAAVENVIHQENADRIQARIVAELANGPTTPEADQILYERGIYVIPDILCNAGGVTVSYFEQVQNAYNYYWDLETVHERLDKKMTAAFHAVHRTAQEYGVNNRMGAYIVAVSRVAEACKLRGWV